MANISLINNDAFTKNYSEAIKQSMIEASDPIVQQALKEIEKKMREKLAIHIMSVIKHDFKFDGTNFTILVKHLC